MVTADSLTTTDFEALVRSLAGELVRVSIEEGAGVLALPLQAGVHTHRLHAAVALAAPFRLNPARPATSPVLRRLLQSLRL